MAELQSSTLADPIMQKVTHFITNGWLSKLKNVPPDVKAYFPKRDELIVDNGVILKGFRVVAPESLCKYIQLLQKEHPGAHGTKRRAKDIVYWPSLMLEIHSAIASCQPCNCAKPHQQKEPLLVHPAPELLWSLVSTDIFDCQTTQYLTLVDSYSGWFEMNSLRDLFRR